MATQPRQAVIVLGMHRSGTSATAGTAVRLGLLKPSTMLAPAADNPSGFYESLPVAGLNHLLLRAAGCQWHDCLSFDLGTLNSTVLTAAYESAIRILRAEFGDGPGYVMKDPRLCLTLPIWIQALHAMGDKISILLVVRHPVEVTRSLFRRDRLPESAMAAVWLHHLLEAERLSRGLPRAVIFYDELPRNWRDCMMRAGEVASINWPNAIGGMECGIDRYLDGSFRHHTAAEWDTVPGVPVLADLVSAATRVVRSADPALAEPSAHMALDLIRIRFQDWRSAMSVPAEDCRMKLAARH